MASSTFIKPQINLLNPTELDIEIFQEDALGFSSGAAGEEHQRHVTGDIVDLVHGAVSRVRQKGGHDFVLFVHGAGHEGRGAQMTHRQLQGL